MTLPPGKRQRRLILSDDDEPVVKTRRAPPRLASVPTKTLPTRKSTQSNATTKKPKVNNPPKDTPKSSPEKGTRGDLKVKKQSKSLHTFFGRATEEQRWARKDKTPPSVLEDGENGDDIEDDSLDEAFAEVANAEADENKVLDRRKAAELTLRTGALKSFGNGVPSSQKFAKPSTPAAKENKAFPAQDNDVSSRPWAERFAPVSLDELAVHKKKVTDVQNWLSAVLQGRDRRRLLVLKGPAGSGKTTAMSLLSKAMGFGISEWRSPTVADSGLNSFSAQFDDFLNRAGAFGTLNFSGDKSQLDQSATPTELEKRVLLVEEFPSTMTLFSSALASFRNILLQYLAAAVPPRSAAFEQSKSNLTSHPPLVLIISESLLTSATASADSFTAHRLLGPDLCNHPYATILEFNPIAPTLVTKALELAIRKEARVSKRRRVPGPAVLKRLSELGDVRSAVNGLEFLCVRGDTDSDWGGTTATKIKKSNKSSSGLTSMEKDSLELVTQREATLGIFHAVGKVVWNKREEHPIADPTSEPSPKPPDHLSAFDRPKVSQVDIDELLNEIGTDIQTFTAALHENYILSSNGSQFTESAANCTDFLSDSDLISPSSRQLTRSCRSNLGAGGSLTQAAGGVDMLRQNEISFQIAVRGLLFSLPSPVSRASHPNGRKGDSFKMFYPASLKIWKPSEEIYDLISLEMGRMLTPAGTGSPGSANHGGSRGEGVESWRSRSFSSFLPAKHDHDIGAAQEEGAHGDSSPPRVWATRDEVLLERLPYMARLKSENTREIKKITQLHGIQLNGEDEADEHSTEAAEVDLSAADETTDRAVSASPRKGGSGSWRGVDAKRQDLMMRSTRVGVSVENEEARLEKLYISEDDIEDE
ncbi:hypothetical protein EPUS_00448 [Endocarpon pusillum Z07020]|uniref:Checkpoint protein RAD24-like helical bundle domain-containing protein n=1 Tax=Endocarpon pusillum (strain Z07020 / HMAS-L-300199) TaxID=1263415 RepID=U1HJ77_ENDPU|nr:uncharacterized protein EPUS_00448 [Endocarpon pusillum Z07020]ERF70260.1 hypothetical protein EPUS_00448 [Endocarpon pusillum Z07020]